MQGRTLFVGNGVVQMTRAAVLADHSQGTYIHMTGPLTQPSYQSINITFAERLYDAPSLNGVLEQHVQLQNLPSCVVAHVMDARPGMRVLDMCAAPGGKTVHIASRMSDQGTIDALERSPARVCSHSFAHERTVLTPFDRLQPCPPLSRATACTVLPCISWTPPSVTAARASVLSGESRASRTMPSCLTRPAAALVHGHIGAHA